MLGTGALLAGIGPPAPSRLSGPDRASLGPPPTWRLICPRGRRRSKEMPARRWRSQTGPAWDRRQLGGQSASGGAGGPICRRGVGGPRGKPAWDRRQLGGQSASGGAGGPICRRGVGGPGEPASDRRHPGGQSASEGVGGPICRRWRPICQRGAGGPIRGYPRFVSFVYFVVKTFPSTGRPRL